MRAAVDDEEQSPIDADRERDYDAGRLMAFSDGVFAIAITLLVLNVPIPSVPRADGRSWLPAALLSAGPPLLTFALSFLLVGFYWIRHHQLFRNLLKVNVWLLWLNLVVLFLICLLPFAAGVVTRNRDTVGAAEVYALNLAAIALAFTALYVYAIQTGQVRKPPGLGIGLLRQGVVQPLVVVILVMVLAPINLPASYIVGVLLMAVVGVYSTVRQAIRSAPVSGTGDGRLRFGRTVAHVTIGADSEMPELFRARFAGPEPAVTVAGNAIHIEYRRVSPWAWRHQTANVALNHRIPWRVELLSGAATLNADLSGLQVREVTVEGGTSRIELGLPRPSSTVPIRIRGDVDTIVVRHPHGVPISAEVRGGVAKVRFDGQTIETPEIETRVQSPDYATATDRYDLEIAGAAGTLDVRGI